eukprot:m.311158 g.311158  ORF g.311158 m.311158 type:complete len:95 (+) comp61140_c0_seq1:72-356(+)
MLLPAPMASNSKDDFSVSRVGHKKVKIALFRIEVQLASGKYKAFVVHKEDDPRKIAAKFCSRNDMNADLQRALEYCIREEVKMESSQQRTVLRN